MVLRGKTRITRKGQITIPAAIRGAMGLHEGDAITIVYEPGSRVASVETARSVVQRTAGILHRPGMPTLTIEEMEAAIEQAATAEAAARDERSRRG